MLHKIEDLARLLDPLARVFRSLGLKTDAARIMAAVEVIAGLFLGAIAIVMILDDLILGVVSLLSRGRYQSTSGEVFAVFAAVFVVSMALVVVHERSVPRGH